MEYNESVLQSIEKQILEDYVKHKKLKVIGISKREMQHVKMAEKEGRRLTVIINNETVHPLVELIPASMLQDWHAYKRGANHIVLRRT